MTTTIETDLNALIASGINARVEAAVGAAFAGDDMMREYVAKALTRPIVVKDGSGYGAKDRTTTFLNEVISKTIQAAAETAVRELVIEESDVLRAEVRKALKKKLNGIADALVENVVDGANSSYPRITAEVTYTVPR